MVTQTYETWVRLENRIKDAQAEMESLLATREMAADLRKDAQEVFAQGEAIRERA